MSKYARPRISVVIDEDAKKILDILAEAESIPSATLATSILNNALREIAKERGLLEKPQMRSDRKT